MFQGLSEDQIRGAVEAMLFVTDEPVGTITLAEMLECDVTKVEQALESLRDALEFENRGIQLREVAGGWRLFTHPVYHELIEKYVLSWDTRKLSGAAMETLAIIAYTQPVTRGGVASVRGVNSDSSINSLVEKGLVREMGVADTPGNPVLYGTTRGFLEKFGLRSTADLPDLAEFAPDDETRRLITERLSATRDDAGVTDAQARLMAEQFIYGEADDDAGYAEDGESGEGEERALGIAGTSSATGAFDAAPSTADALDAVSSATGAPNAASSINDALNAAPSATGAPNAVSSATGTPNAASSATGAPNAVPSTTSAPSAVKFVDAMFAEAIASTLGVVDKIDFDSLTFETDDE